MNDLLVGPGSSLRARLWAKGLGSSGRLALVSEPRAFRLFGAPVLRALRGAGFKADSFLLPQGESAKSWPAVERLLSGMLKAGLGRDAGLAALGGGAVTDAAGFAASVYMRGIPWASLPTTLLGQLDGGIGGKTGINLSEGKNLAGVFHQPRAVVCDTRFLKSLSARDRISGLGEAVKYGLVFEPALWRYIREHWARLLKGEPAVTAAVVRRAAAWKVKTVAEDPGETKGARELLNFGHTLGHALEGAAGYGRLRHGEAVIWGMRAALALSVTHAGLAAETARSIEEFLAAVPVPVPAGLKPARLLELASRDKKARAGAPRFVLLRALGRPVVIPVARAAALAAVKALLP